MAFLLKGVKNTASARPDWASSKARRKFSVANTPPSSVAVAGTTWLGSRFFRSTKTGRAERSGIACSDATTSMSISTPATLAPCSKIRRSEDHQIRTRAELVGCNELGSKLRADARRIAHGER